ncbi:hypothetical protein OO013_03655 [Mangrovivirga sp. M17]|uniref:Uncharacterized protein n=1 Tax=Mangrovivirga halotolerans TaxID=2993936 RepID=A0ABT3RMA8_9BACT|nr:hypothetical protein [Mangrovivirga halotolerans]MCX2742946.1 hypothetical protein [Mangrovivirga halotolerans]
MRTLLAFILLAFQTLIYGQVQKASLVGDELFSVKKKSSQSFLYLHQNDSTKEFDHAKYKIDASDKDSLNLANEITTFNLMWESAVKSGNLKVKTIQIDKPEKFNDVLKRLASHYLDLEEKPFLDDYEAIGLMIHESGAYRPIYEYLRSKGLEVEGVKVEQVGIARTKSLNNVGIPGSPIVPIPYLIYLQIKSE